jgi:hypothetical protein
MRNDPGRRMRALRLGLGATLLALLPSCTNGVNAGREGGVAFILFTVMLILTVVIMWIILGRER